MKGFFICLCIFINILPQFVNAQLITGRIYDTITKESLPFATVKFGNTSNGIVADLDGKFEINLKELQQKNITYLSISCLGYETQNKFLIDNNFEIYLQPSGKLLNEAVILPPYNKIRKIINNAIAQKDNNNPDKMDWYQCNIYYKMIADVVNFGNNQPYTSKKVQGIKDFLEHQYLLIAETYSKRTWKQPKQLQEDVKATRFSGYKRTQFASLVTDVLPFHAYDEYIKLNGKDFHNPISKGFMRYYNFNLNNELYQGKDTIWELSFYPKSNSANEIRGKVYINSDGYAISYFLAKTNDTFLKQTTRIEQEYDKHTLANHAKKWFPKHLNYIIDFEQPIGNKKFIPIRLTGTSKIDSVNFIPDANFKFNKAHTTKILLNKYADTILDSLRPDTLNTKEQKTYQIIDSIGAKNHLDDVMDKVSKLPMGKLAIGFLDWDLKQLCIYNQYEGIRLGLGLQTNGKILKWLSLGGYAGYGFSDVHWKYGIFTEAYLDHFHEFVLQAGYKDDINNPGKIHLDKELDKDYLDAYLLYRVDHVTAYSASIKKKLGYWNLNINYEQETIQPLYLYSYYYKGSFLNQYHTQEISILSRYAFAERTAPALGYYYGIGTQHSICYNKITYGNLFAGNLQMTYIQDVAAVSYQKHINRLGAEKILLCVGASYSNHTLPISKLFAANGYNYNSGSDFNPSIYTFGGMMTILSYQYYADKFINFYYRHDFDWKIWVHNFTGTSYSSAPYLSLQYGLLYGTLNNLNAQKFINFSVSNTAYHEAGFLVSNILRIKYFNYGYLDLHLGYFYHIQNIIYKDNDGRFVFGGGFNI